MKWNYSCICIDMDHDAVRCTQKVMDRPRRLVCDIIPLHVRPSADTDPYKHTPLTFIGHRNKLACGVFISIFSSQTSLTIPPTDKLLSDIRGCCLVGFTCISIYALSLERHSFYYIPASVLFAFTLLSYFSFKYNGPPTYLLFRRKAPGS